MHEDKALWPRRAVDRQALRQGSRSARELKSAEGADRFGRPTDGAAGAPRARSALRDSWLRANSEPRTTPRGGTPETSAHWLPQSETDSG